MFPLILITVEVKNTICNSLITMFTTSWRNLIKIGWSELELYKMLSFFYKKPFHMLTITSDISLAPFWKRFLQVKQFHDAKWFNTRFPSFVIPKITVYSLTHETWIKDAVNMEDLTCLLATIRTLNHSVFAFSVFTLKTGQYLKIVFLAKFHLSWKNWLLIYKYEKKNSKIPFKSEEIINFC